MKYVLGLSATLILSLAVNAAEVTHDNTQCPDLNGKFMISTPTSSEITFTIEMVKDGTTHHMAIVTEHDSNEFALDGIPTEDGDVGVLGACSNQRVYVYEYYKSQLMRTTLMSLLPSSDLLIQMDDQVDGQSELIGTRQ